MPRVQDIIRRGTRALQPAATAVTVGTIYYVTDEGILERSTGAAWESYSSVVLTDGSVTYAKMQAVSAASKLLGRGTAGTSAIREITLGTNLTMSGDTLNAAGASATVFAARVVLTDAQIKTNSTVPIEIVPAEAGVLLSLKKVSTIKQTTAGAYSANPNFSARYNGVATDLVTAQSIQILSVDKRYHEFADPGAITMIAPPIGAALMFRGSADVTGGNAANYVVVQYLYTKITDGP